MLKIIKINCFILFCCVSLLFILHEPSKEATMIVVIHSISSAENATPIKYNMREIYQNGPVPFVVGGLVVADILSPFS